MARVGLAKGFPIPYFDPRSEPRRRAEEQQNSITILSNLANISQKMREQGGTQLVEMWERQMFSNPDSPGFKAFEALVPGVDPRTNFVTDEAGTRFGYPMDVITQSKRAEAMEGTKTAPVLGGMQREGARFGRELFGAKRQALAEGDLPAEVLMGVRAPTMGAAQERLGVRGAAVAERGAGVAERGAGVAERRVGLEEEIQPFKIKQIEAYIKYLETQAGKLATTSGRTIEEAYDDFVKAIPGGLAGMAQAGSKKWSKAGIASTLPNNPDLRKGVERAFIASEMHQFYTLEWEPVRRGRLFLPDVGQPNNIRMVITPRTAGAPQMGVPEAGAGGQSSAREALFGGGR